MQIIKAVRPPKVRRAEVRKGQIRTLKTTFFKYITIKKNKMLTINFMLFNSRNTAETKHKEFKNYATLKSSAELLSKHYHHVTAEDSRGNFERYENGKMTEWSYPNGLGMIKLNS
jgi:hypothetical protein